MPRPKSSHPTALELQILKILWERSPLPVREVRLALGDGGRELAHTSVITTLGVMVRKKYLRRAKQRNALLFTPEITREEVSDGMLSDIVNRVFDGSPTALMACLFNTSDVNRDEIKELRRLIRQKVKEQSQ